MAGALGKSARAQAALLFRRVPFHGSAQQWDELCARFDDFTVNQSYAWGEGRRSDGWDVRRDLWLDESGELCAAATVLRKRVYGVPLTYISRGPLVVQSGLPPSVAEARFAACTAAYRRGLRPGEVLVCAVYQTAAEIAPDAVHQAGLRPLFPAYGELKFSSLVRLDEPDALVRGASSDWRKLYRRSEGLLGRVRESSTVEDFLRARALVARLEAHKGFTTTLSPGLLRAFGEARSQLFYLENERGEMAAALMLAIAGRRASRLMAGVAPDETREHKGIGRVLEVAASRWAFSAGASWYDLEGMSPRNPGVTNFKVGMRGEAFMPHGTFAASRPAFLAAILSWAKRRPWREAIAAWRSSKSYFLGLAIRSLTGGRIAWRTIKIYRLELGERPEAPVRSEVRPVFFDGFDRRDFHHRLGTLRTLWRDFSELRRGEKECCVLLGKEGFAVAYGFFYGRRLPLPEIGAEFALPAGEAYISQCYVLPDYRGRRLYPHLLEQIGVELGRRGVRVVRIASDAANRSSIRGIERAGFVESHRAAYRRIGSWRVVRWAPRPFAT